MMIMVSSSPSRSFFWVLILSDWPKSSFGFFHNIIQKNLNEFFGQLIPDIVLSLYMHPLSHITFSGTIWSRICYIFMEYGWRKWSLKNNLIKFIQLKWNTSLCRIQMNFFQPLYYTGSYNFFIWVCVSWLDVLERRWLALQENKAILKSRRNTLDFSVQSHTEVTQREKQKLVHVVARESDTTERLNNNNETHHINRINMQNYTSLSIDRQTTFDKIQHQFVIRTSKVGIKENFLNLIKGYPCITYS